MLSQQVGGGEEGRQGVNACVQMAKDPLECALLSCYLIRGSFEISTVRNQKHRRGLIL